MALIVVSVFSVWLAVRLTPPQQVSVGGQSVRLSVTGPWADWTGPGTLALFGRDIPTAVTFHGPLRPRLALTEIRFGRELDELVREPDGSLAEVGRRLAEGWFRYALWQSVIAAGVALVILVAVAVLKRLPVRSAVALACTGLVLVSGLSATGYLVLANDTPKVLRSVDSLEDLVGRAPPARLPPPEGPVAQDVRLVVLGDSTAAGAGNRPLDDATAEDRACRRSSDAFSEYLERLHGRRVLSLACAGATIKDGLLGTRTVGGMTVPPQLSELRRAPEASAITVSIGANDVRWAALTRLCTTQPRCGDRATDTFFDAQLARFSLDYRELLRHLAALPGPPRVVVTEYYDPFGEQADCLSKEGITPDKARVLRSYLADLNAVLREGAEAAGFPTARPDFAGHGLCTSHPYVRGPAEQAPLHPTATGQLAIALAVQRALLEPPPALASTR
ncbi:SGNH/GDSL hydrolase family protein [Streptomyces vilmorinianum]|uniref:SGNH/GDSL hydrolase family protein n=1 Tax=Streptomyces vilmorinianum TaxID=3051092 RepID=UPI00158680A2|nr:SGNH/GDSL hydrolase family protein [Streptomyces vilmorinianum]